MEQGVASNLHAYADLRHHKPPHSRRRGIRICDWWRVVGDVGQVAWEGLWMPSGHAKRDLLMGKETCYRGKETHYSGK
jgi:hypothetical protein